VQPQSIHPSFPEVGERIVVIGTPLGLDKTVSDGIVSAVREVPEFGKIIQLTAPISPGSSGSPVVNINGEVVCGFVFLDARAEPEFCDSWRENRKTYSQRWKAPL